MVNFFIKGQKGFNDRLRVNENMNYEGYHRKQDIRQSLTLMTANDLYFPRRDFFCDVNESFSKIRVGVIVQEINISLTDVHLFIVFLSVNA